MPPVSERWPPIYDAGDLARTIREMVDSDRFQDQFYRSEAPLEHICQGDIVRLQTGVPVLAANGQPAIHDDVTFWMVIGNTCDIVRELADAEWSQLCPLVDLGAWEELSPGERDVLRRYRYSRRFYVPPWSAEVQGRCHVADFLRPVAIHKTALNQVAALQASLTYYSWILLHSCLVRFLARDDGRFAA